MATDFFDRQDNARRQTTRLLIMFGLSVIAIIVALYLVLAIGITGIEQEQNPDALQQTLWQPVLFLWVALGTIVVVGLGSLYKISELSAGGEQIAAMLGGRLVNPQTNNLDERRLLNVVEEMALASGIAVPPVYILDNESGINAFAAGHQPGDAIVAVSAGGLRYLNREELQGVMAHEFSHILNGDMRLNLRLIGIVYGILVLAVIGFYTMRIAGVASTGNSRKSGGTVGIFLFGIVMLILGYIGVFFGHLIKSAISRQREFLADASAVQFTRDPGGIAGALKKIGGMAEGSKISDAHAEEISHMFFSNALAGSFMNLFATHPPLAQRIKALEPNFDGIFPKVQPLTSRAKKAKAPTRSRRHAPIPVPIPIPIPVLTPAVMAGASGLSSAAMVQQIGQPSTEHLRQAAQTVDEMPQVLLEAAHEPFVAQALVFALLLSRDDESVRNKQLQLLQNRIASPLYKHTKQLVTEVQALSAEARLPLVALTTPALKTASSKQYGQFRQVIDDLVSADNQVDLFEYSLRVILFRNLDVHFGLAKPPRNRFRSIHAVVHPSTVVLSLLAYVGHKDFEAADLAFQAGMADLAPRASLLPPDQCNLRNFDLALTKLAQAAPVVKRRIIAAVTACIAADGKATLEEAELLRAVASALDCPMPPLTAASRSD